jgi:peptide/nickel transport system substrate-binding protein
MARQLQIVRFRLLGLVALALAACGPAASGPGSSSPPAAGLSAGEAGRAPSRLVASIQADPRAFNGQVARGISGGRIRGGPELEWLVSSGLTVPDDRGTLLGQLAEAAPSAENGLWKVLPDGRMETTWIIRQGARWHDGTPLTAQDLTFTANVVRDPELASTFRDSAWERIESVESRDARTIVVTWNSPYIDADRMFSNELAPPIPRHLLEATYNENKDGLIHLPYWLSEFVGSGPFALRTWVQGSHVILNAYPEYVLGKPKLDQIEVRFIMDSNAVVSNLLAGGVELTLGYGLSLEQALELRRLWGDGRVEIAPNGWIPIHPQFLNPRPPVVADVRFRRALLHALDRQEMVETLQAGQVTVAHVFLNPVEPEYPAVESAILKYEFDLNRARRGLEELGYARGADGMYVDTAGQRLSLDIAATEGLDIQVKAMFAVSDAWQRLGIEMRPVVKSSQTNVDREENANFPGFRVSRQPNPIGEMTRYLIASAPVAGNRYTGQNFARYMNQEYNDLIERYFLTIPKGERLEILRQVLRHQSESLHQMGLFYNVQSVAIGKRVQGVTNSGVSGFNQTWNAHLWSI